MKLAMIPLVVVALLVSVLTADEIPPPVSASNEAPAPPGDAGPLADQANQAADGESTQAGGAAASRSGERPESASRPGGKLFIAPGRTTSKASRDTIQAWLDQEIVQRSDPDAVKEASNTLRLYGARGRDSVTEALEALSKVLTRPLIVTLAGESLETSAELKVTADTEADDARRILDVLKSHKIEAVASRIPSISLWFVRSTFDSLDASGADDLKAVFARLGLDKHVITTLPKAGSETLFGENVALVYEPDQAASTLAWLHSRNLVMQVTWPDRATTSRIALPPVASGAGYGSDVHVTRRHEWSWSVDSVVTPGAVQVSTRLSLSEQWRGEATPRVARDSIQKSFRFNLEPGKVAIVHAFPLNAERDFDPEQNAILHTARKAGFLPLLVIENHALDVAASSERIGETAAPKLTAPQAASPITLGPGRSTIGPSEIPPLMEASHSPNLPASSKPPRTRIVIIGDGSAMEEADRQKLEQLISDGVVERGDALAAGAGVHLMLHACYSAAELRPAQSGGGFSPSSGQGDAQPKPVNPNWDQAIRELRNANLAMPIQFNFFPVNTNQWSLLSPDNDARLVTPLENASSITKTVSDVLARHGMTVASYQRHPYFGEIAIPEGKEVHPVYLSESASPSQQLVSIEDSVDVMFLGLNVNTFVLERAKIDTISASQPSSGGRKVVGLLLSPEDANLLRRLERHGRLEAYRRDPTDHVTRIRADLSKVLLANLEQAEQVTDAAGGGTNPSSLRDSSSAPNVKVVQLKNTVAGDVVGLLTQVIQAPGFVAVADSRTNSVVLTSTNADLLQMAETLLEKLDSQQPPSRSEGASSGSAGAVRQQLAGRTGSPAELAKAASEREAAAARYVEDLRQFVTNRNPTMPEGDFRKEEQQRRRALTAAVRQSFTARQAMLAAELAELQRRVEAAQRSLELRNRAADEIIARRVEDLLNPELKWEEPQVTGGMPPTMPQSTVPGAPHLPTGVPAGQGAVREPTAGGFRRTRTIDLGPLSLDQVEIFLARIKQAIPDLIDGAVTTSSRGSQLKISLTDRELAELQSMIDAERSILNANEKVNQAVLQSLTGIWQSSSGMNMGMGGFGGYGEPLHGMSGDPPPRLVIDGDCAALYVKNERRRLWTMTLDQPGQASSRVTFTPLDDQPGMEGSFNVRERSLTVVSTGATGAKIERYSRSIAAVPPDWSKQIQDAAREKRPAAASGPRAIDPNAPEGFAPRPRVDLSSIAPAGPLQTVSKLTGLWATAGHSGAIGMGMDMEGMGAAGTFPVGAGGQGKRPQTYLAISGDRAALYEKNERKQSWTISVIEADDSQIRLDFTAAEGQPGMQGIYTSKGDMLSVVSTGELGATIVRYKREVSVVPPEWAAELHAESPRSTAEDDAPRAVGFPPEHLGVRATLFEVTDLRLIQSLKLPFAGERKATLLSADRLFRKVGADERPIAGVEVIGDRRSTAFWDRDRNVFFKTQKSTVTTEFEVPTELRFKASVTPSGRVKLNVGFDDFNWQYTPLTPAKRTFQAEIIFESFDEHVVIGPFGGPNSGHPQYVLIRLFPSMPAPPNLQSAPSTPGSKGKAAEVDDAIPDEFRRRGAAPRTDRQPSDYLQLLEKYRDVLSEYDSLLQTFGKDHPRVQQLQKERARDLQAIEVLRQEYDAELQTAEREVARKKAELEAAGQREKRHRAEYEAGFTGPDKAEDAARATRAADAELEAAEARYQLLEKSRDSLFPKRTEPEPAKAAPPFAPGAPAAGPISSDRPA